MKMLAIEPKKLTYTKLIFLLLFLLNFHFGMALAETYGEIFSKLADAECKDDQPKKILFSNKLVSQALDPMLCANVIIASHKELFNYFSKNKFNYDKCITLFKKQESTVIDACFKYVPTPNSPPS